MIAAASFVGGFRRAGTDRINPNNAALGYARTLCIAVEYDNQYFRRVTYISGRCDIGTRVHYQDHRVLRSKEW